MFSFFFIGVSWKSDDVLMGGYKLYSLDINIYIADRLLLGLMMTEEATFYLQQPTYTKIIVNESHTSERKRERERPVDTRWCLQWWNIMLGTVYWPLRYSHTNQHVASTNHHQYISRDESHCDICSHLLYKCLSIQTWPGHP